VFLSAQISMPRQKRVFPRKPILVDIEVGYFASRASLASHESRANHASRASFASLVNFDQIKYQMQVVIMDLRKS
jgi:hypothetical protein